MVDTKLIVKLRQQTGAGMNDCKKALDEANGDYEKAIEVLRKKGAAKAAKKMAEREASEGLVYSYIHANGRIGVLLDLSCETDFVARNEDFKQLAHDIAMQIAAQAPDYVKPEDVPAEVLEKEKEIYTEQLKKEGKPEEIIEKIMGGKVDKFYDDVCLLKQTYIKDDSKRIEDYLTEVIAKLGEKIEVRRFARFEI